jgi:PAS domain S-box-containing protein
MTLEKRIILFSFSILFLTILASTGMDIFVAKRGHIDALVLRSQNLGTALKSNVEKVLNLGLDIREVTGLSDKCREIVEGNPEIAYCVIADMDGKAIFLSSPVFRDFPAAHIKRTFLLGTQQVNVVDFAAAGQQATFYDTIANLKSADGRLAAQVHVGFNESVVAGMIKTMIIHSVAILVFFLFVSFSLVVLFVKVYIMKPVSSLMNGVKRISEGAFETRIREPKVYEFNELARNINSMSESLQNRDAEIKRNYQDLENTHDELHSSYLKLENLSIQLEKSEELYKSLTEDASDAIVVIGADETVRMVNKMAENFFGYSAQEIEGLPLTKMLLLLNIENIPKIHRIFKDAAAGSHIAEEMQIVQKGGALVVGLLHASSIKSGGENLVQAIFRDVTREREIIYNLEQSAADLARLNKMKDSFLGLASHELKTPLTVIMGYSELILTDMADKTDKTILEMVGNIAGAAERLDNIIKDMVDVSMIDEKRLQLKMEPVQLNRLVESSVNELSFFFSKRRQEVVLNLDASIPAIMGDSLRLMQLLSNILGNAIKFTPDGGKILVSTSAKYLLRTKTAAGQDHLPAAADKEHHLYVEIAISDTGIGIDREDQLRIFDKFYEVGNIQEHSTGKVAFKGKGAGLGLSIAKGIVDMHGGEIWVESSGYNPEFYAGSTFHILLPLNPLIGGVSLDYMDLVN